MCDGRSKSTSPARVSRCARGRSRTLLREKRGCRFRLPWSPGCGAGSPVRAGGGRGPPDSSSQCRPGKGAGKRTEGDFRSWQGGRSLGVAATPMQGRRQLWCTRVTSIRLGAVDCRHPGRGHRGSRRHEPPETIGPRTHARRAVSRVAGPGTVLRPDRGCISMRLVREAARGGRERARGVPSGRACRRAVAGSPGSRAAAGLRGCDLRIASVR